jgi:alkanesulfonate monooxygenase SsuD/methylene tetrahydromethanopterin reductase-like flavin-dependent oxidoreductase (luciferase family)
VNSGVERQLTDLATDVTNIGNTLSRASPVLDAINSGRLQFGVVQNAKHKAQLAGIYPRDETTDDYANYQTFVESLRGAYLMAFKGVQTEGDAQRAMDSIVAGRATPRPSSRTFRRLSIPSSAK